ncbi:MAG: 3-deoxy-manno-octulosonate cytidylyltransferase [Pseudomonadota bacterium]
MKIIGIVPARMASSRFPGKPLALICGRPMVEHVFCRAKMFSRWDGLYMATCDEEIAQLAKMKDFPVIMTSNKHTRCLDRVAEATGKCGQTIDDGDVIICVQGDEPMLEPAMIEASIRPLFLDDGVNGTVLAMEIVDEEQFKNSDTVKIVHDMKGDVLYTSRSAIPYCKHFGRDIGARRIYGIFAFRWGFLKLFTHLPESPLELQESCDSNRIIDHGYKQRIAPYPFKPSFSVDNPHDLIKVEQYMKRDLLWGKY